MLDLEANCLYQLLVSAFRVNNTRGGRKITARLEELRKPKPTRQKQKTSKIIKQAETTALNATCTVSFSSHASSSHDASFSSST
jgi:hypothetical protein